MSPQDSREAQRRSRRYGRLFSALVFGSFFLIAGLIGYDLDTFAAVKWRETPVLSEVVMGGALLLLAAYWSRRLDDPRLNVRREMPGPRIVGRGRSSGAERRRRLRPREARKSTGDVS